MAVGAGGINIYIYHDTALMNGKLSYDLIAKCLEFSQLKFNICARCYMAFIEPMHHNKLNNTYFFWIKMNWWALGCNI